MEIPDSHCAFVQGGPGTGKSFCINTNRNVTRQVFSSMRRDLATAPTGCAAQLINGVTGTRAFKMPVGKALLKPPTNLHVGDVEECIRYNQQFLGLSFSYTGDESSMEGRPIFAWRESRMRSSRSPYIHPDSTDEEEYDLIQAHPIPPEVYGRPYGGVPIVSIYGDCNQLPPIGMKALHDFSPPRDVTSADAIGRLFVQDFLRPSDPRRSRCHGSPV